MKTYSSEYIHWLKHHVPTNREEYLTITAHASQFPPAFPRTVYLEIGERCNLDCSFCSKPTRRAMTPEMDWPTIARVIRECAENGTYYITYHNFNEPLLHLRNLLPAIALARDCGIPMRATTTNITPLTPQTMEALIHAGLTSLHMSFEGANRATYEQSRGVKYAVIVERIMRALETRRVIGTKDALGRLLPWMAITMVQTTETQEEIDDFLMHWGDIVDDVEVRPALEFLGRTQFTEALVPAQRIPCRYIGDRLIVTADGTITACSVDVDADLALGNVMRGDTLKDVWQSERYRKLWALHQWEQWSDLPEPCKSCQSYDFLATARSQHFHQTQR
ncbi:MAG TPA: radical SAM/SPASM domain-containing protein [Candidatus Tectomicrobia bacterium]